MQCRYKTKYKFRKIFENYKTYYVDKTKAINRFVLFSFIVFVIINLAFIISSAEPLSRTSSYYNYYMHLSDVYYYNSYYEDINTKYVLTKNIPKVSNKIYCDVYFNSDRYNMVWSIALSNDKIKLGIKESVSKIKDYECSTEYKDTLLGYKDYADGFGMKELKLIEELLLKIFNVEKLKESIFVGYNELLSDYSSESLLQLLSLIDKIQNMNKFDQASFDGYIDSLNEIKNIIDLASLNIVNIKMFYEQLSSFDISEIDPNDIESIYYNLRLIASLPKGDRDDLEYINKYLQYVIDNIN